MRVLYGPKDKYFPGTELSSTLGINEDGAGGARPRTGIAGPTAAAAGAFVQHPTWWRDPNARSQHELAGRVISSREKAESNSAFAHLDALNVMNALGRYRAHPEAVSWDRVGASNALARPAEMVCEFGLARDVHAHTTEEGTVLLFHMGRATTRTCTVEESTWIAQEMRSPNPSATSLLNDGYLRANIPLYRAARITHASLLTNVGGLDIRLLNDRAADIVVAFARLATAGMFSGLPVRRSCPGHAICFGAESQLPNPAAPEQVGSLRRGVLLARHGAPPLGFSILRAGCVAAPDGTVPFGEVIRGWDTLDCLIAGDVVHEVILTAGAAVGRAGASDEPSV